MNATAILLADPLPAILDRRPVQLGRRHRIDNFPLDSQAMDAFNRLLARLDSRCAPLDRDGIVTAARELRESRTTPDLPVCIRQLMCRATTLACMSADPGWKLADDVGEVAGLVLDYLQRDDDLIPDTLPTVGRLDDAIVVHTAWPRLAAEVVDYLDFCRLRQIEAGLRGCDSAAFSFTRADWEQAHQAEIALVEHQRHVREESYLPAPAALFRVH